MRWVCENWCKKVLWIHIPRFVMLLAVSRRNLNIRYYFDLVVKRFWLEVMIIRFSFGLEVMVGFRSICLCTCVFKLIGPSTRMSSLCVLILMVSNVSSNSVVTLSCEFQSTFPLVRSLSSPLLFILSSFFYTPCPQLPSVVNARRLSLLHRCQSAPTLVHHSPKETKTRILWRPQGICIYLTGQKCNHIQGRINTTEWSQYHIANHTVAGVYTINGIILGRLWVSKPLIMKVKRLWPV